MKEKFIRFMQGRYGVDQWMGFCDLLLFPGVFQECEQTVFGESGFPDKDIRYQKFLPETEKYMAAEKSLSYLYLPVMQTEDPHTEG